MEILPRKKKDIKKIVKYQNIMKAIVSKQNSLKKRRKYLSNKTGAGLLSLILPLAIGAIGSLIR